MTATAIVSCLPFSSMATHSRWSGREVNFRLPEGVIAPRENQSIYVSKGDVVYWRNWVEDGREAVLAFYYGAERTRDWRGDQPVNVIGRITAETIAVAEDVGERIWLRGAEGVQVAAMSGQGRW